MSENNVHSATAELKPEDVMLTHRDTPEQELARNQMAGQVKEKISTPSRMDPKRKTARNSDIVVLRMVDNGEEYEMSIPIHSLTPEEAQEIQDRYEVKDKDKPEIPQVWDEEHGGWIDNIYSQEYLDWLTMLNKAVVPYRRERLLMALNQELVAVDNDDVVWSPTDPNKRDRERALQALIAMEFQGPHLTAIDEAINNLSIQKAQEEAAQLEGESQPSSASQNGSSTNGTGRGRRRSQRRTR